MEIRKEDLVKFKTFESRYLYGIRSDIFDKAEIPETIEEVEKIIEEIKGPSPEEIAAKLKEEKKAKLLEELKALEE